MLPTVPNGFAGCSIIYSLEMAAAAGKAGPPCVAIASERAMLICYTTNIVYHFLAGAARVWWPRSYPYSVCVRYYVMYSTM
jgi:hypothetical protein